MSGKSNRGAGGGGGAVYGLGFIGAVVYYWQRPTDSGSPVGHREGILWPAFVVYDLLGHLGA